VVATCQNGGMSQPPPIAFRVRPAVAADEAALVVIDATSWSSASGFPSVLQAASQPGVTFFSADSPPGTHLVAEVAGEGEAGGAGEADMARGGPAGSGGVSAGQIIGYIKLKPPTPLAENGHVLLIGGIAVLAAARGQGVAAASSPLPSGTPSSTARASSAFGC
jgi:hypothetical protein